MPASLSQGGGSRDPGVSLPVSSSHPWRRASTLVYCWFRPWCSSRMDRKRKKLAGPETETP